MKNSISVSGLALAVAFASTLSACSKNTPMHPEAPMKVPEQVNQASDPVKDMPAEPAVTESLTKAPEGAKVSFVNLKDGQTVSSPFKVQFGVQGMKVLPAGNMSIHTGHHHLIVDGEAVAAGTVVAADDKHIHFGKGETETELRLAPGTHALTLQFANGAHQSYGPEMSATIHITVK